MRLADLRRLCVERFPMSITRQLIYAGLEAVVIRLNQSALPMEIWVDGSFVTEKLNPQDVDFVARVHGRDFDGAALSQKSVLRWINQTDLKSTNSCDCYAFVEYHQGHPLGESGEWDKAYWLRQFGFSRSDTPKGIPVISLPAMVP